MPVLKIDTNQDITSQRCKELLHNATELLSIMLDKPKGSIMVSITPNARLMLADSTEPSAYIELKLFAFPDEGVGEFVKTLTEFVKTEMGVAPDFQFHWFVKMESSMFGWNGKTC